MTFRLLLAATLLAGAPIAAMADSWSPSTVLLPANAGRVLDAI